MKCIRYFIIIYHFYTYKILYRYSKKSLEPRHKLIFFSKFIFHPTQAENISLQFTFKSETRKYHIVEDSHSTAYDSNAFGEIVRHPSIIIEGYSFDYYANAITTQWRSTGSCVFTIAYANFAKFIIRRRLFIVSSESPRRGVADPLRNRQRRAMYEFELYILLIFVYYRHFVCPL